MSLTAYLIIILLIIGGIMYVYNTFLSTNRRRGVDSDDDSDGEGEDEVIEEREFTLAELHKFDGVNNEHKKVYVSICGQG